jgi:uncharacterized Zn finger protein
MKLTLKNFEQVVDSVIVNRGLDYFERSFVTEVEKLTDSTWRAIVEGTSDYQVQVALEKDTILHWTCDCPFDFGPICKHVVAVWYKLREHRHSGGGNNRPMEKSRSEKIIELLKNISDLELRMFLQEHLQKNDALFQKFSLTFQKPAEQLPRNAFKKQIKQLIRNAAGRDGFIDYHHSFELMENLSELLDQAEDLAGLSRWENALNICLAVIETIPNILEQMDDSAGMSAEIFNRTCVLCQEFTGRLPSANLKDQLFWFLIQEFPKEKYRDWDLHFNFLDMIMPLLDDEKKERSYLNLLNQSIEKCGKKDFYDMELESLLLHKIDFYRQKRQPAKAQEIMEKNIELTGIRKILLQQNLEQKDFSEAEKLIMQGIDLARKKEWPGIVHDWKEELIKLYEITGNQPKIRELAEELFLSGLNRMDHYHKLKATYRHDQWQRKWPDIVKKMRAGTIRPYFDLFTLGHIYVEEQQYKKLLELLQEFPENLNLFDEFYQLLIGDYPREILEVSRKGVDQLVQEAGRKKYQKAVHYLKKMQAIEGGKSLVKEMVENYRLQYKNRPAMMQVLNGLTL